MKLTIVVHDAEEGGYWAEVPAIAGCVSQGESLDELLENVREAIEGCLSVNASDIPISGADRVMEIAVWRPSAARSFAGYSSPAVGD